ncbi:MAG: C69 family dipeptidase [Olsenella sp.]|nr:C69 family dipeptidase [Olsenella sp.]
MSTRFRFSKRAQAIIAATLAASMAASPVTALACTQVYIGDALTTDGDTYWGRSEDYTNRYGKVFGIEPATESGKTIQSYENDTDPAASFSYKIDGPTFRYTYVRDTPDNWTEEGDAGAKAYSEAGTNEKGVSVSATLTTDYNDKIKGVDPLVDTGIGEYSATDYVLSLATSARDGVERLGKLVDQVGSQGCNQIVIGDASETWIFM